MFNGCTVNIYNESSINYSKSEFWFGVASNHPVEESCTGTIKDLNLNTKNKTIDDIRAVLIQKLGIYQGTAANLRHGLAIMPNKITKIEDNDSEQSDDLTELLNRKKYLKLPVYQKKLLSLKLKKTNFNISELSRIYNVPRSTLTKLKNQIDDIEQLQSTRISKINLK